MVAMAMLEGVPKKFEPQKRTCKVTEQRSVFAGEVSS